MISALHVRGPYKGRIGVNNLDLETVPPGARSGLVRVKMHTRPRVKVSLGLPVYNGERFVKHAIQSVLDQTFTDFELIISDNASTDSTPGICEEFARKDPRIRYIRQEINVGAKANFNRVFEYSRGDYFKWVAADDVCGPRYLELTVAQLDADPTAVLAHTLSRTINGKGEIVTTQEMDARVIFDEGFPVRLQPEDRQRRLDVPSPHSRFREILISTHWCFEIFALIRRQAMLATYPKLDYYGSDKVMLAQLSLLGRFIEVQELQFFRRAHHGNSTNMTVIDRENWSRPPKTKWKLPTQFPCFVGYTKAALTMPAKVSDRIRCLRVIVYFAAQSDRYYGIAAELLTLVRGRTAKPARSRYLAPVELGSLERGMCETDCDEIESSYAPASHECR
jgi:glycosyltransferase involved in cell wall biosynthesis